MCAHIAVNVVLDKVQSKAVSDGGNLRVHFCSKVCWSSRPTSVVFWLHEYGQKTSPLYEANKSVF